MFDLFENNKSNAVISIIGFYFYGFCNIMNTTLKMQVFEELIILSALWNFENLVE